jgi:hypothetical protein
MNAMVTLWSRKEECCKTSDSNDCNASEMKLAKKTNATSAARVGRVRRGCVVEE